MQNSEKSEEETQQTNEIVNVENNQAQETMQLLETTTKELANYRMSFSLVQDLAKMYMNSQLAYGLKEQDISVKLLKGYELGLKFAQSFDGIDVINGHTSLKAQTMYALILSRCKTAIIYIDELSDKRCVLRAKRDRSDPNEQFLKVEFTIEQAMKKSYVYTKEAKAKPLDKRTWDDLKDNWKDSPESMLFARCISRVARYKFPDVIQNMYVSEEVRDFEKINDLDPDKEVDKIEVKPSESFKEAIIKTAEQMNLEELTEEFCKKTGSKKDEVNTILEYEFSNYKKLLPDDKLSKDINQFKIKTLNDKLQKLKNSKK